MTPSFNVFYVAGGFDFEDSQLPPKRSFLVIAKNIEFMENKRPAFEKYLQVLNVISTLFLCIHVVYVYIFLCEIACEKINCILIVIVFKLLFKVVCYFSYPACNCVTFLFALD